MARRQNGIDPSLIQVMDSLVTTMEANNAALQALAPQPTAGPVPKADSLGIQAAVQAGVASAMAVTSLNLSAVSIRQLADAVSQTMSSQGSGASGFPRGSDLSPGSGIPDTPPVLGSLAAGSITEFANDSAALSGVAPNAAGMPSGSQAPGASAKKPTLLSHFGKEIPATALPGTQKPKTLRHHATAAISRHYSQFREVAYHQDPTDPTKYNTVNPMNQVMQRGLSEPQAQAAVAAGRTGPAAIMHAALDAPTMKAGLSAASGALAETAITGAAGAEGAASLAGLVDPLTLIPTAIAMGAGELAAQRQKNATYASIYGTSNMGGAAQRVHEGLFGLSRSGQITSAQAQQLFQGVSSSGLKGQQRATGLQMAMNLYNDQGITFSNTIAAITASVQAGNPTLAGLATSLSAVATAAQQAGVNVDQATQSFVSGIQTLSQGGVLGQGASVLSAAATGAASNLGPTYKGVGPATASLMASPTMQALVGIQNNKTQEQMVALETTNPQKAAAMFQNYILSPAMAGGNVNQLDSFTRSYVAAHPHETTAQLMKGLVPAAENANLLSGGTLQGLQQQLSGASAGTLNLSEKDAAGFVMGTFLNRVTGGKQGLNLTTQAHHAVRPTTGFYAPHRTIITPGHWRLEPGGGHPIWVPAVTGEVASTSHQVRHHLVHAHTASSDHASATAGGPGGPPHTSPHHSKSHALASGGVAGSPLDKAVKAAASTKHEVVISMTPETKRYFSALSSAVMDISARQSLNETTPAPQHPRSGNRPGNIHQ